MSRDDMTYIDLLLLARRVGVNTDQFPDDDSVSLSERTRLIACIEQH